MDPQGTPQDSTFAVIDGGQINTLIAVCFAIILACANGANDIANSVGTSVGAGAISLRAALVVGCLSEMAGCVLMGGEVAATIGNGVVMKEQFHADLDYYAIAMTAVLAGAGISTAAATLFGLPVSATHGVISGLTAVALFEKGSAAVDAGTLGFTVIGWVASPLVGALVAGLLSLAIEREIFAKPSPAAAAQKLRPYLVAGTVALVVAFLCSKGPKWLQLPWWGVLIAAFGAALLATAAAIKFSSSAQGNYSQLSMASPPEGLSQQEREAWLLAHEEIEGGGDAIFNVAANGSDDSAAGTKPPPSNIEIAEAQFTQLLVLTGCTVAFAHGGNDVGNAVGPLLGALAAAQQTKFITELRTSTLLLSSLGGCACDNCLPLLCRLCASYR